LFGGTFSRPFFPLVDFDWTMSEATSPTTQSAPKSVSKTTLTPEQEKERQEWARRLRLKLSPPDMIKEDGSLNEEYPDYNNFFLLLFI
jgi:hypothetical protein